MPRESRVRKRLCKILAASEVSSCDKEGLRRFRARESGKWGFCKNDGLIVQEPRYDYISFEGERPTSYKVAVEGKLLYCIATNGVVSEMDQSRFVYESTFGA